MKFLRKVVTYNNIKSHKKPGLYPLCRRHVFGKTTGFEGEGVSNWPAPSLLRVKQFIVIHYEEKYFISFKNKILL